MYLFPWLGPRIQYGGAVVHVCRLFVIENSRLAIRGNTPALTITVQYESDQNHRRRAWSNSHDRRHFSPSVRKTFDSRELHPKFLAFELQFKDRLCRTPLLAVQERLQKHQKDHGTTAGSTNRQ